MSRTVTTGAPMRLTMYAIIAYNAGMSSIQYTIRSIPPKLDQALRQTSKTSGKSLNEVVVTALEKGAGVSSYSSFEDLDWFIGSKSLSTSFGKDMDWLDNVPKE